MPRTVERPSPVPLPSPLVVKNGSQMRASTSGGMPVPVSRTSTVRKAPGRAPAIFAAAATSSVRLAAVSVSWPPSGMASRAFTHRLRKI